MWIRKALILMAVVASTVVMPARPALACSCMPIDAATTLGEAPAAFVGTVVDVREAENPREFEDAVFTFRVDEWVKGDLGDTVEMRSSSAGASCGFEMRPGQQSGIIVRNTTGELSGGLCDRVDADVLRLASKPLALPTGGGPIALLVAGSFGGSGLIALDGDGNVLGYGPRATDDAFYFPNISVCPGSRNLVELIGDDTVYVRELATLQIVDEMRVNVPLGESEYAYFSTVACRSEDASDILVFGMAEHFEEQEGVPEEEFFSNQRGIVYRLEPGGFELFFEGLFGGEGPSVLVGPNDAVALSGFREPSLIALDLDGGETRELYRYEAIRGSEEPPFVEGMAMSPNGRYVAAMDATLVDGGVDYYLSVFDLEAADPLVSRAKMLEFGQIAWVDNETIAYALNFHLHDEEGGEVPAEESGTVQLFRASDLELVAEWVGWTAGTPVVIDGMLYGLTYPGSKLVTAPAASGPMTEMRSFPGSVQGLVPVHDGPELDASAAQPRQATGNTVPPATLAPGAASKMTVPTTAGGSPDPAQTVASSADGGSGIWTPLVVGALMAAAAASAAGLLARRRSKRTESR